MGWVVPFLTASLLAVAVWTFLYRIVIPVALRFIKSTKDKAVEYNSYEEEHLTDKWEAFKVDLVWQRETPEEVKVVTRIILEDTEEEALRRVQKSVDELGIEYFTWLYAGEPMRNFTSFKLKIGDN